MIRADTPLTRFARYDLVHSSPRRALPLVLAIGCFISPSIAYACIPPPQTFKQIGSSGFTESVNVSGNLDANDDTARPYGSIFYTDRYCRVTLTAKMPPGLEAYFNVLGTNAEDAENDTFRPETSPIALFNNGDREVSRSFIVPLRHKITEFYLSTPSAPEERDTVVRLKGGVTISAVAATCSAGNKTTTAARGAG
jgi:hypothetical protein